MKLCILMGSADISGGSYVIFEQAMHLLDRGWQITAVPLDPLPGTASRWHPALDRLRFARFEEIAGERFDLALATWWKTVYELSRVDAAQYGYFVQSIESWFYPDDDVAVRNLVNSTYLLPLPGITEARWIRAHLKRQFGLDFHLAPNGCRKDLYRPDGPAVAPRRQGGLRVLVEGALGVDFKNVARTIALLRRSRADEIWLLTISPIDRYPGVARVFSRLPIGECPAVYRSCDVLVKLSTVEGMFGPPLEMFHCGGTAVVYNVTGHDEYIVNDGNALVIPTGDEAAAIAAVNRLKDDPALLARLKRGAAATAAGWPDWTLASTQFEQALRAICAEPAVSRERIGVMTREFFQQYVRAETVLNHYRKSRAGGRLASAARDLARAAAGRLPWAGRTAHVLRGMLMEGRAPSRPRTRI